MFVVGSQYLRGESPRQEDWDRDMANMKKLGFNTIRAWLVWSTVESREGQINEEYLNRFMDTAERNGLQVGFLFHLHGAPAWAVKKYPQYYYVSNRERVFEPSARSNTPGGGWPGLCYDYPEVQTITLDFISRVVQFLSPRKRIAFWEPMNEPHIFYDNSHQEIFCYCKATRKKFREWLKKKYGSIKELNISWGRFHNDWDEIIPTTWDYGFTDVIDYRCFLMDNLVEELQRRIGVIRKYDSRPVIAHAWGGGCTICPVMPAMAFDDWKNASIFDKWGYSAFPASYQDNAGVALGTTAARGAARGKVFWQSELGSGDNGSGIFRTCPVREEEITSWVWESIARGAKGLLFWQYRKELYGSEIGGYALTDYDGTPSNRAVAISQVNRIIQENESLFNDSNPLKAEVAILYSPTSYLVEWAGKGKDKDNRIAVDSYSGYFRMFWENSLPVDAVHEDFISLDELKQYKILILPFPLCLSDNFIPVLKNYIEEGGWVLSDPYLCPFDQHQWLDKKVPGRGLDKVFGVKERGICSVNVKNMSITYKEEKGKIESTHFLERFELTGGKAIAFYDDGSPAIVSNNYGKGKAIISGLNLGLSYSMQSQIGDEMRRSVVDGNKGKFAKDIVLQIALQAGVEQPVRIKEEGVTGNILVNKDKDDVLIVINHVDKQMTVEISFIQSYSSVTDLYSRETILIHGSILKAECNRLGSRIFRLK